jgi:hypothetical protein
MNTKQARRSPAVAKKTYVKHADGNSVHWWATKDDLDCLERLKANLATAGLMKPSSAVVLRAGLMLLERYATELAAVASRVA